MSESSSPLEESLLRASSSPKPLNSRKRSQLTFNNQFSMKESQRVELKVSISIPVLFFNYLGVCVNFSHECLALPSSFLFLLSDLELQS